MQGHNVTLRHQCFQGDIGNPHLLYLRTNRAGIGNNLGTKSLEQPGCHGSNGAGSHNAHSTPSNFAATERPAYAAGSDSRFTVRHVPQAGDGQANGKLRHTLR